MLRIEPAESAEPARGFGALFKRCKAAVCNPANHSIAVNCAPRMVLNPGPGRPANPDDAEQMISNMNGKSRITPPK
jgi:hypothetical protein